MPKAEAGTAKAIGNAMKAKGLGRLRWFCQVCQKQCRDENGFKMHSQSESHLRQMLVVGENAGKHIDDFSKGFLDDFIALTSRRHNTQRVRANAVYNEYIQDKTHLHMNATKWVTLTEFVKYLGKEGICRVDEDDKGLWISWIDNSPKALARQAEAQKREKSDMDDEQRERKQLKEMIDRARVQAEERAKREGEVGGLQEGLKREEGQKLSLSFGGFSKPKAPAESTTTSEEDKVESTSTPTNDSIKTETPTITSIPTTSIAPTKLSISANPLKRPAPGLNVFKQSSKTPKSSSTSSPSTSSISAIYDGPAIDRDSAVKDEDRRMKNLKGKKFLTAAEKVMLEDMERKNRMGRTGYAGMGPSRNR